MRFTYGYKSPTNNKMKKLLFIIFSSILPILSFSQKQDLKFEFNFEEYYVDTLYNQMNVILKNDTENLLVFWVDLEADSSLSINEKIREYFYKVKGDFSLFQLIYDGNVASYTPLLSQGFFKTIKPNDSFTITIRKDGKVENWEKYKQSISEKIIAVKATEIGRIQFDESLNQFEFSCNTLVWPNCWLKNK